MVIVDLLTSPDYFFTVNPTSAADIAISFGDLKEFR